MRRVAAIDCGTNSVRLLIADISGDELTDVERRMEIVRLGQGVDKTGRLAPDALERTFGAMRGYAKLIREHGGAAPDCVPADVMPVRVVATSATRDASNRADFVAGVQEIFGVDPEVVSGSEEAHLSFVGATRDLHRSAEATGVAVAGIGTAQRASGPYSGGASWTGGGENPGPYLVVDIGGGSTEFVVGSADVEAAISVDIGCVRLTERHLAGDSADSGTPDTSGTPLIPGAPPSGAAVQGMIADIEAALDRVEAVAPIRAARTLVGLAGSVTTVAGIALDLPAYDSSAIHHARIPAATVHEVAARLQAMTHEERAAIPVMHPGRVDVIGAGALILDRIVRRGGFTEVVASEQDILDGIAWSLV